MIIAAVGYAYTPTGGGACSCDSCSDCTDALNDNTNCYTEVQLTTTINDHSGNCIDNPENFTNKTFNCAENQIDGDGTGGIGIFLENKENNTITNCLISDFEYGIWLSSSNGNNISSNWIYNSILDGIYINSSSNNNLTDNYVYDSGLNGLNLSASMNNVLINNNISGNGRYGFYADSASTGNSLDSNTLCVNNQLHSNFFDVYDDDSNTFTNNTCDSSYPSGKCDNPCSYCYIRNGGGVCTVPSGGDCSCVQAALNDNANCYKEVRLDGNVSVYGTCIDNPPRFQHKTLNCLNNVIQGVVPGYGIYLIDKTNVTIKNCAIKGFTTGIYGEYIANSSFEYVSAINNGGSSLFLCYSGTGIQLIESYNIKLLHINASSNVGGRSIQWFGCSGTGLYLNISNSTLNDIIADYNSGGSALRYGGSGSGIVLVGAYNTLNSINTNYNRGGSGSWSGGVGEGLYVSGENNKIARVTSNNNTGGGKGGEGYGILFDTVANTTLSSSTTNSNRYGIYVASSTDNTLINNKALSNYFHGIYLDSTSTNNTIRSNRFCDNNQSAGDYYDVYDEDANIFLFNTCDTSNPDGLCAASCAPLPSGGGGENKHKLYIYDIAHQYAKKGERKNVTIIVENRGDYREYNVILSLNCPSQLSCQNASLGDLSRSREKNVTVEIVGNVAGDHLIKVEARSEATSAETEFYFTVEPECTKNADCAADEKCESNECVPVKCDCGYVENHECIKYECCTDAECNDASVCSNHRCVPVECECGFVQNHACVPYECCSDSDCAKNNKCEEHKCVPVVYNIEIETANINVGEEFVIKVTADGNPMSGVSIVVVYPDGSTSTVLSREDGRVFIPARQEGRYKFYIEDNPSVAEESYAQLAGAMVQQLSGEEQAPPSTCCLFGICGDLLGVCWYWMPLSLVIVAALVAALIFFMRGSRISRRR